jgi:hypothetical protein
MVMVKMQQSKLRIYFRFKTGRNKKRKRSSRVNAVWEVQTNHPKAVLPFSLKFRIVKNI